MNRKRWLLVIVFGAIVVGVFAILPRSPSHPPLKDSWPPASQYLVAHPEQAGDSRDTSRYVPMRDGVRIAVTTTMPSSVREGQRIPGRGRDRKHRLALAARFDPLRER